MFQNRREAGECLAAILATHGFADAVIYALPRGGIPVAEPIASKLNAPLDLIFVRKIGAPEQPELALGAVVDGATPVVIRNEDLIRTHGVSDAVFAALVARETTEIARRRKTYLLGRAPLPPKGRTAIVIDDGLATGASAKASIAALRAGNAKEIILAVPVAPVDTLHAMEKLADKVFCLKQAAFFPGVGAFYNDFRQLSDDDVITILRKSGG